MTIGAACPIRRIKGRRTNFENPQVALKRAGLGGLYDAAREWFGDPDNALDLCVGGINHATNSRRYTHQRMAAYLIVAAAQGLDLSAGGKSVERSLSSYLPYAKGGLLFIHLEGRPRAATPGVEFRSIFSYESSSDTPELTALFNDLRDLSGSRGSTTSLAKWSTRWPPGSVVAGILATPEDSRNAGSVVMNNEPLYRAGVRVYKSWDAALRASGLEPSEVRRGHPAPPLAEVTEWIAQTHAAGLPLNCTRVKKLPGGSRVYRAAGKIFAGGWPEAVAASTDLQEGAKP